jgi:hypothetical protein
MPEWSASWTNPPMTWLPKGHILQDIFTGLQISDKVAVTSNTIRSQPDILQLSGMKLDKVTWVISIIHFYNTVVDMIAMDYEGRNPNYWNQTLWQSFLSWRYKLSNESEDALDMTDTQSGSPCLERNDGGAERTEQKKDIPINMTRDQQHRSRTSRQVTVQRFIMHSSQMRSSQALMT